MKLTADDYQRHYRELGDDEFLAIRREDLVEIARRCYDAELAHRQLALEPELAAEDSEPELEFLAGAELPLPDEEMVQVAILASTQVGKDVMKMLREADVPSTVTDASAVGRYAESCFGLLVPKSCADSVRDLISGHLSWNNQELVRHWFERDWTPDGMALDDFSVSVDDYFGEENKVAARITVTGVDPSTKEAVKVSGMAIVHLADGIVAERWIKLDR